MGYKAIIQRMRVFTSRISCFLFIISAVTIFCILITNPTSSKNLQWEKNFQSFITKSNQISTKAKSLQADLVCQNKFPEYTKLNASYLNDYKRSLSFKPASLHTSSSPFDFRRLKNAEILQNQSQSSLYYNLLFKIKPNDEKEKNSKNLPKNSSLFTDVSWETGLMGILISFAVFFGFFIGKRLKKCEKPKEIQEIDTSFVLDIDEDNSVLEENETNTDPTTPSFLDFMSASPIKSNYSRFLFDNDSKSTIDSESLITEIQLSMPEWTNSNKSTNLVLHYSGSFTESSFNKDLEQEMQKYSKILEDGKFANSFEMVGQLGKSKIGQIYQARHRLDGHIYAVKVVELHIGIKENIKEHKLFKEVLHMSKINSRYLKRYYSSWIEASAPDNFNSPSFDISEENSAYLTFYLYIQTEFMSGISLDKWIENEGKYDRLSAYKIFKQIVKGVHSIHSQKLAHGDLKSSNIFLNDDLSVKIGDFKLYNFNDEGKLGSIVKENRQKDVYQLGKILLELSCPKITRSERSKILKNQASFPIETIEKKKFECELVWWLCSTKNRPKTKDIINSEKVKHWEIDLNISPSVFNWSSPRVVTAK